MEQNLTNGVIYIGERTETSLHYCGIILLQIGFNYHSTKKIKQKLNIYEIIITQTNTNTKKIINSKNHMLLCTIEVMPYCVVCTQPFYSISKNSNIIIYKQKK